jgi:hypothetical protein
MRLNDRIAWRLVVGVYLVVFGAILVAARGLPYPLDNNESFSSLWHARNLHNIPWSLTKGLPDEVAAWHAAASPFIHTHQGDFPRIFAYLIYLLGARTIQSQIIIATFTVGVLTMWFAYRFLRGFGPPLFAAITCLVMITNYALFAQWQANTYRIWYGFLFFSSVLWVQTLGKRRHPIWLLAGILNFASLFYGEYVFAAFVALTSGFYALLLYARQWRVLLRAWLGVVLGCALAAGTLLTQLTFYMGWANILRDVHYVLSARNMAFDPKFADEANQFYFAHHIVFYANYVDAGPLRNARIFMAALFGLHFQYYDPWIALSCLIVLTGCLLGICSRRGPGISSAQEPSRRFPWLAVPSGLILLGVTWFMLHSLDWWADDGIAANWQLFSGLPAMGWLGATIFGLCALLGLAIAVFGPDRVIGRDFRLSGIFGLSLSAILGYIVVYYIFTGYINSGYLNRQAPFLVFWTDILVGSSIYFILEAASSLWPRHRTPWMMAGWALVAVIGVRWLALQSFYVHLVPPTNYSFLRILGRPPFRGETFAVNTYSPPIADQTRAWAYDDSTIYSGQLTLGPAGFRIPRDTHYVWFADAATNPSYLKPTFGLLISQPSNFKVALDHSIKLRVGPRPAVAFSDSGAVERSLDSQQAFLKFQFMGSDGDSYSIFRFDWDYPPFLRIADPALYREVAGLSLRQRVTLSEGAAERFKRWLVEIEPLSPPAVSPGEPARPLLAEASIDDHPIFSDAQLAAPGPLSSLVIGSRLRLRLQEGPRQGKVRVRINELSWDYDLQQAGPGEKVISLVWTRPYGKHTVIPNFPPGIYVRTTLSGTTGQPTAEVAYRYAQQDRNPEELTTLRIYHQRPSGQVTLADAITFLGPQGFPVRLDEFRRLNPDTLAEHARIAAAGDGRTFEQWLAEHLAANPGDLRRAGIVQEALGLSPLPPGDDTPVVRHIPLPAISDGSLQISVAPGTRTKVGPEYFGLPFSLPRSRAEAGIQPQVVRMATPRASTGELPYGDMKIRLRFPSGKTGQAEPIVATGIEEGGDFVYVIYPDATHIRLGFDHWFSGGPLTPPIAINYARDHELEISMGSLSPLPEDAVFVGVPSAMISQLKTRVTVTFDGTKVIDAPTESYASSPQEVTVGHNLIKGTTSNPLFTGKILSSSYIWPELGEPALPPPRH